MSDVPAIDEDLQSRQMAVYGREAMQNLKRANVLISGLNGLGAEVAKNVILANVNSVTLHDACAAAPADLGSHFYLSAADVGRNRAEACVQLMQELNPSVRVAALSGTFPTQRLAEWNVVVAIDMAEADAVKLDALCRAASPPIAFLRADVRGLCGSVFVDLGPEFVCVDPTGEAVKSAIVERVDVAGTSASGETKLTIQCVDDEPLDLDDGDHISFSEVCGMTGLNGAGALPVSDVSKGKKRFSVTVPAAQQLGGEYTRGGIVTESRQPKRLSFRPLSDFLALPGELAEADDPAANVCYGRSGLLHLAFRALDAYRAAHGGALPPPADDAAAEELLGLARGINDTAPADAKVKQLDDPSRSGVVRLLSRGACAVLSPMAAIFGGVVGQEVIKAATGKFHPIVQGFYLDALECAPESLPPGEVSAEALHAAGRYAAQAAVFGRSFVGKLRELNVFLVGSGALGCEFLKGFAMLGVACGDGGKLAVTDDDIIEKSNLSRQFLFRNHNVGQSKSLSACSRRPCAQAVTRMNPELHARALQDRVAPETEGVFDAPFWRSLDVVVNALDNARLYVDGRCVLFTKPLLESGTLGAKCNTQVVLPHRTENYGASRDPPEKQAPLATAALPTTPLAAATAPPHPSPPPSPPPPSPPPSPPPPDVRVTCGAPGGCIDVLVAERATTFAQCVGWARRRFETYFHNRIAQLLFNFPPDAITSQGVPFWSPPKRLPRPLAFDLGDPLHMQFVLAAARLRAHLFGLAPPSPDAWGESEVRALLATPDAAVPPFTPAMDASIETDNKEEDERRKAKAAAEAIPDEQKIAAATAELAAARGSLPAGFKVDDDTNFHMDFISAFGNLRARNYAIDEIDKFQAKLKAGRIIPAIATATAMATGFVLLELYKEVAGKPLDRRRNLFANLALPGPLLSLSEPMACAKIKSGQRWDPDMYMDVDEVAYPEGHSLWDQIPVPGAASMTLEALRSWFTTHHQLVLTELTLMHGAHARARALPVGALTPGTPPRVRLKVGERLLEQPLDWRRRRQPRDAAAAADRLKDGRRHEQDGLL
ncbi:hypothetical protein EMIHUDRAFT_425780 [Emiliania huxleyi CCMP1516]|uniref:Ubiquitin-activating enzyme E1 C-terminal domain-containing protein n=2 Tax=Emiliania huxleyi TaxID=2903 RepID=A0A0D3L1Q2_EMIH1|nr:hypothetical protein EMIHUDRAFT_425780 [Emiliania huxleyi CCMP1516]EOD41937.1 hypothetical protein EMIHUDRAFT_425780 [Emiliania huxleyi CCMP1516]|eukprot:XP_005794366.1 hypothetical protein EMIHUDRAFT_425780 [Emiliania huxleyi CCMP1516]